MKEQTACCIRCHSENTEPYGERYFCINCGFTWHKDSVSEEEELARRKKNFCP